MGRTLEGEVRKDGREVDVVVRRLNVVREEHAIHGRRSGGHRDEGD